MSRSTPAPLLAKHRTRSTDRAFGILIKRIDGVQLALTSCDVDKTITGVPINGAASGALKYLSDPGLEVGSIRSVEGIQVDTLEGKLLAGGVVTTPDILRGLWNGSAWTLFEFDASNVSLGFDVLKCGWVGKIKPATGYFSIELRDLGQPLQQSYSYVMQVDCPYNLGDSDCTLSLGSRTDTVTVTAVTSGQVFSIATARPDDFFGDGSITWLTGNNAPVKVKVKTFTVAAGVGTFTLSEAMLLPIVIGDTATAVVGCRKRHVEDCVTKFANVLNFGGFPDKPLANKVIANPQ